MKEKLKSKRLLSLLLMLCMVFTMLPMKAWAAPAGTSTIKFVIENGSWNNRVGNSFGSDASISADGTTLTINTTWWNEKVGYVYKCGGSMESMLNAVLNGTGANGYIVPDTGYTLTGLSTQDWQVISGGLTGSTKDANGQMQEIKRNVHGYDDHMIPVNGFEENTVYKLTLTKSNYSYTGSIDNGNVTNSSQTLSYNDTSKAMVFTPSSGYSITGVTVNDSSVGFTVGSNGEYTYPAEKVTKDIAVKVATKAIDYTVIYQNEDGSEISSETYNYGDTVTVPSDPSKAADKENTYSFAGWTLVSGTALGEGNTCAGNATYKASFTSKAIDYPVSDAPKTGDNSNMALWIALLFVSGTGVFGTTVYSKKKKSMR